FLHFKQRDIWLPWKGAVKHLFKVIPFATCPHQRGHSSQVLFELRMAGVRCQPLMMSSLASATCIYRVEPAQLVAYPRSQPLVNQVVGELAREPWELVIRLEVPTAQPTE